MCMASWKGPKDEAEEGEARASRAGTTTIRCMTTRCGWCLSSARRARPCCSGGLRIGYGRAAHLIDLMYKDGLVGPADGSKPREMLKSANWIQRGGCGAAVASGTAAPGGAEGDEGEQVRHRQLPEERWRAWLRRVCSSEKAAAVWDGLEGARSGLPGRDQLRADARVADGL